MSRVEVRLDLSVQLDLDADHVEDYRLSPTGRLLETEDASSLLSYVFRDCRLEDGIDTMNCDMYLAVLDATCPTCGGKGCGDCRNEEDEG